MKNHESGHSDFTQVKTVELTGGERTNELTGEYNLPFLADFLSDIASRRSPASEAEGRRYQQEIVRYGELKVSPCTGKTRHLGCLLPHPPITGFGAMPFALTQITNGAGVRPADAAGTP